MSQYTIIYKYGKRTRQLKTKRELKNFSQETMAARENRFAPELNKKEVIIELLEALSNIMGAFLIQQYFYSARACWMWDDYSQFGAIRLVGYLSSHIRRALVE